MFPASEDDLAPIGNSVEVNGGISEYRARNRKTASGGKVGDDSTIRFVHRGIERRVTNGTL